MKQFFETLKNIFSIEDLRKRILLTLGLLFIYRLGCFVVLPGVDPTKIATELNRAAAKRQNKKISQLKSAMSMLSFYINRAGKNLTKDKLKVLNQAKVELRKLY